MEERTRTYSWPVVIGSVVFCMFAGLVASYTSTHAVALVVRGFGAIGLGILFLLAYYFEKESIFFHWLIVVM